MRRLIAIISLLALSLTIWVQPVSATEEVPYEPPPTVEGDGYYEYETVAEVLDPTGKVVSTQEYDQTTAGKLLNPQPKGGGKDKGVQLYGSGENTDYVAGTGRIRVKITATKKSNFGEVLFRYRVWTEFSWNRVQGRVYNVEKGWRIYDLASNVEWIKQLNQNIGFYAWRSGYPNSGHRHYRQGMVKNCPFAFIPCDWYYPEAQVNAHSNGSFWWMTGGV